eukprot:412905-Pelagomonas_calceolata.AAC.3
MRVSPPCVTLPGVGILNARAAHPKQNAAREEAGNEWQHQRPRVSKTLHLLLLYANQGLMKRVAGLDKHFSGTSPSYLHKRSHVGSLVARSSTAIHTCPAWLWPQSVRRHAAGAALQPQCTPSNGSQPARLCDHSVHAEAQSCWSTKVLRLSQEPKSLSMLSAVYAGCDSIPK